MVLIKHRWGKEKYNSLHVEEFYARLQVVFNRPLDLVGKYAITHKSLMKNRWVCHALCFTDLFDLLLICVM